MKHSKRSNIYQCSNYNCTFDPTKLEAFSYRWWKFVGVVEGKVIFNNYRYSNSTSKHQSKVRRLMAELGIEIDVSMPIPQGLPGSYRQTYSSAAVTPEDQTLAGLIVQAEEYLCDAYLLDQEKKQERYQRAKLRKMKSKLEDYLENSVHFRDYEIKDASEFGKYNKIAVHQVVDIKDLENDVQNALHSFHRDGFGSVVFYVGGVS